MANPWAGYAAANDSVRHEYERMFYGRQLTGNLTENDVPGMTPQREAKQTGPGTTPDTPAGTVQASDLYGIDPSHEEREGGAVAWQHAENAPGIRREMEEMDGRRYTHTDAPDLVARGVDSHDALYGPDTSQEATTGNVWGKGQGEGAQPAEDRLAALYGPAEGKETGSIWEPAEGAAPGPAVEPTSPTPAAPDNDLTPG